MGYHLHCRWMTSHSLWTKNLTFKNARLRESSLYSQLERMPWVKRRLPNGVFPCVAMTPGRDTGQETKYFMMRLGYQCCHYISRLPYPSSSSMSKIPVSFSDNRGKRYHSRPFWRRQPICNLCSIFLQTIGYIKMSNSWGLDLKSGWSLFHWKKNQQWLP